MTDETAPVEPSEGVEPAPIEDELTRLRRVLDEAKQRLDEKTARYLRAVADLDNQRKRAHREREDYIRFANESVLRDLLPVLDNFDRALGAARAGSGAQSLLGGVGLTQREWLRGRERFGVPPTFPTPFSNSRWISSTP